MKNFISGFFRKHSAFSPHGTIDVYEQGQLTNPHYIINFPTKDHWKGKSRLEFVDAGLEALIKEVRQRGIRSIAIPPLGCGLGGLKWSDVRPRIERAFESRKPEKG